MLVLLSIERKLRFNIYAVILNLIFLAHSHVDQEFRIFLLVLKVIICESFLLSEHTKL